MVGPLGFGLGWFGVCLGRLHSIGLGFDFRPFGLLGRKVPLVWGQVLGDKFGWFWAMGFGCLLVFGNFVWF